MAGPGRREKGTVHQIWGRFLKAEIRVPQGHFELSTGKWLYLED
jgi:hypothetical protein